MKSFLLIHFLQDDGFGTSAAFEWVFKSALFHDDISQK
jgi:hypothetical protein